jgi:hypothetical protein
MQGLGREDSSSSSSIGSGATDDTCPRHGMRTGDPSVRRTLSERRTFWPSLQWLSLACLDAPYYATHTHTHTHTHVMGHAAHDA